MDTRNFRSTAVAAALSLFALWTLATWWFEGRIETLLRPDAAADRVAYALVANLLVGTVVAIAFLRLTIRRGAVSRSDAGFGPAVPSVRWIAVALALGLGFYAAQGAPWNDPAVLTNAFAQVLATSVAEVIVCWSLVGAAFESFLKPFGKWTACLGAPIVASFLFGLYHSAHSAPFNSFGTVALLSAVGLVTSTFFFVSRDSYATILFHNFLGFFGVLRTLDASDRLDAFQSIQVPLLVVAAVAIGAMGAADWLFLRRADFTRQIARSGE